MEDDFMEDGHFMDYEDKVAAELFWEHVVFKDDLSDEEHL